MISIGKLVIFAVTIIGNLTPNSLVESRSLLLKDGLKESPDLENEDLDDHYYDYFTINNQMRNYKEKLLLANEKHLRDQEMERKLEQEIPIHSKDFHDGSKGMMKGRPMITDDTQTGFYPYSNEHGDPYAATKPFVDPDFHSYGLPVVRSPLGKSPLLIQPKRPPPIVIEKRSYIDDNAPLPFLDTFKVNNKTAENDSKQADVIDPSLNKTKPDHSNSTPNNTASETKVAAEELKPETGSDRQEAGTVAEEAEIETAGTQDLEKPIEPEARIESILQPTQAVNKTDGLKKSLEKKSMVVNETATTEIATNSSSEIAPIVIPEITNGKNESAIAEEMNNSDSSNSTSVNGENEESPESEIKITNAVNGTVAVKDAKMIQNGSQITVIDTNGTVLYTFELPAGLKIVHNNDASALAEEQFAKGILKVGQFDDGGIGPKTEIVDDGNEYTLHVVLKMGLNGLTETESVFEDSETIIAQRREREVLLVVITLLSLCIIAAVVFAVIQYFRLRRSGQYELVNMASEPIARRIQPIDFERETRQLRQKACKGMALNDQKSGAGDRIQDGSSADAATHTFGPQFSNVSRTPSRTENSLMDRYTSWMIRGKLACYDSGGLLSNCKLWKRLCRESTTNQNNTTHSATNQEQEFNGSGFAIPMGFDLPAAAANNDDQTPAPEDETPVSSVSDGPTPIQNADEGSATADEDERDAQNHFFGQQNSEWKMHQPAAMDMLPMKIPLPSTSTNEQLNQASNPITFVFNVQQEQKPSAVNNGSIPPTAVDKSKPSMKSSEPEKVMTNEEVQMEKRTESDSIEKAAGKVRFNEKVDVVMTDEIGGIEDWNRKPTSNKGFEGFGSDDNERSKWENAEDKCEEGGVKLTRKNAVEFVKFSPHQNPNDPSVAAADDYYKDLYQFRNLKGMNSTGQTLLPPKQYDTVSDEDECSSYTVDLDIDDAAEHDPLEPATRQYFTQNVLAELSGWQESSSGKKLNGNVEVKNDSVVSETSDQGFPTTSRSRIPPDTTKLNGILFVQGRSEPEETDAEPSSSNDAASNGVEFRSGTSSLMIEDFWPQSEC